MMRFRDWNSAARRRAVDACCDVIQSRFRKGPVAGTAGYDAETCMAFLVDVAVDIHPAFK